MTAGRAQRPPARCLVLLSQLSKYIDYELTPRQRRAIDVHCHDCARCQRMIVGLQRTVALYQRAGVRAMPTAVRDRAGARIARLLSGLT